MFHIKTRCRAQATQCLQCQGERDIGGPKTQIFHCAEGVGAGVPTCANTERCCTVCFCFGCFPIMLGHHRHAERANCCTSWNLCFLPPLRSQVSLAPTNHYWKSSPLKMFITHTSSHEARGPCTHPKPHLKSALLTTLIGHSFSIRKTSSGPRHSSRSFWCPSPHRTSRPSTWVFATAMSFLIPSARKGDDKKNVEQTGGRL